MKKIFFAIAIIVMLAMTANAQRDGFFNNFDNNDRTITPGETFDDMNSIMPGHGLTSDPAPLGTGLLILTALGAGYAVARKKK